MPTADEIRAKMAQANGISPTALDAYKSYQNYSYPVVTPKNSVQIQQTGEPSYMTPQEWDYKNADKRGPLGETLPDGAVGWTPQGTPYFGGRNAVEEWFMGLNYNVIQKPKRPTYDEAGNVVSKNGAGYAFRVAGKALTQALPVFGFLGQGAERAIGVLTDTPDALLGEESPRLMQLQERWFEPDNFWKRTINAVREGVLEINPVRIANEWITVANKLQTGELSREELKDATNQAWQASRMLYTGWANEALYNEFTRRYKNGENPYLLAQELNYAGVEAVGQGLLDPLNWLGVGLFDEAGKTTNVFGDVAGLLADTDRVMDAAKLADISSGILSNYQRVFKGIDTVASETGLFALTSAGKVDHVATRFKLAMNGITRAIVDAKGVVNPDTLNEVNRAMWLMGSEVGDDVTEGFTLLSSIIRNENEARIGAGLAETAIPLELFLTEDSAVYSRVLRELIGEDRGKSFEALMKNAATPDELLTTFAPKLNKATSEMFPTLAQRVENGEKLGMWGNFLLSNERIANSELMTAINSGFARLYMGSNPGYVARNILTNTVHTFFDQGFGAAKLGFLRPAKSKAYLAKQFGAELPNELFGGIGQIGDDVMKTILKEDVSRTFLDRATSMGLELGAWAESNAGARIMATEVRNFMDGVLVPGRAIPEVVDELVEAGFSKPHIDSLQKLISAHDGDLTKVKEIFAMSIERGEMSVFDSFKWVSPDQRSTLTKIGIWDDFVERVNGISVDGIAKPDDISRVMNELFDELDVTDDVVREIQRYPLYNNNGKEAHHLYNVMGVEESQHIPEYSKQFYHHQMIANKAADNAVVELLNNFTKRLGQLKDYVVPPTTRQKWLPTDEFPEAASVMTGRFWEDASNQFGRQFTDTFSANVNKVKNGKMTIEDFLNVTPEMEGYTVDMFKNLSQQQFADFAWDSWYRPYSRNWWAIRREQAAEIANQYITRWSDEMIGRGLMEQGEIDQMVAVVKEKLKTARAYDAGIVDKTGANHFIGNMIDDYDDIIKMGSLNGIPTATKNGVPYDHLLSAINDYTGKTYDDLHEIPFDEAQSALQQWAAEKGQDFVGVMRGITPEQVVQEAVQATDGALDNVAGAIADDVAQPIDRLLATPLDPENGIIYDHRHFYGENGEAQLMLRKLFDDLGQSGIAANGKFEEVVGTPQMQTALDNYIAETAKRLKVAKTTALNVANAKRDFALVNYASRRNIDTLLGQVMPYQFWHTRTINNWAARIAQDPSIVANYMRYRSILEKEHAGMPEWWKYNVNTNELFGLDMDNPLYWNLEATLNPLNGLLGTDFDDPAKRPDWLSTMLMEAGNFGPAIHPMLGIANAFRLYLKGEEDAASRWGGRLFPQTQTIGAMQSMLASGFQEDSFVGELAGGAVPGLLPGLGDVPNVSTLDPLTVMFSGGVDPYTARRVDRALASMVQEGIISEEQAIDAATQRGGDIYATALERAINGRAPGQVMSFFFGVGFKGRSASDMQSDIFFENYNKLWNLRSTMTSEEFRNAMTDLKNTYPFGEVLLIGRKGGDERDTALAYNVLDRIPPGQTALLQEMGLDSRIINQFYEQKGTANMSESDRLRFMSAVVDLAAILAIPENATRLEWTDARNQYGAMKDQMAKLFGDDIHDLIDGWYNADNKDDYLERFPQVSQAMDWRGMQFASNPASLMTTYYGGFEKIEGYYRGVMYDQLEQEFGSDIWDIQSGYFDLYSAAERKVYLAQFPQLKAYWDKKSQYEQETNATIAEFGQYLQDPPKPELRQDITPDSIGQQDLVEAVQGIGSSYLSYGLQDWQQTAGDMAIQAALASLRGDQLSDDAERLLTNVARDLNISDNQLITLIGISYLREK